MSAARSWNGLAGVIAVSLEAAMHQLSVKNLVIIFGVITFSVFIGAPTASAVAFAHDPTRNRHAAVQHEVSSARRVYGHHDTTTSAENERCVNQVKEASSGTTNKGEKVSNQKRSNVCGA